jgi:hypothetical protein
MMTQTCRWLVALGGLLVLVGSGCSVQQQQEVLGAVGRVIPGSKNSVFGSGSSGSEAEPQAASEAEPQAAPAPAPRVDPARTDAQLVLHTLQRAMTDNPPPFQECLDNPQCKIALTAHLIRLQKQAMSTLELPPVYDRYDLKRGRE